MRSIKVTFDNGDWLETNINGTNTEILKYYIGNQFNLGDGAGGDLMAKAVRVEFLDEVHTVYCSQCGGEFRHHLPTGFSHCENHRTLRNWDR